MSEKKLGFEDIEKFGDDITDIFDNGFEQDCGKDQIKINGLAMLLTYLEENASGEENTTLDIPLLCKIQALTAAYNVGKIANG